MRFGWAVLIVGIGCKGGRDADTDGGVEWPVPKAWQVDGEEGSLVVTVLDRAENPEVQIYGVFADETQGWLTAGACIQDVLPCIDTIPGFDDFTRANNNTWRPRGSEYRWVGDEIYVGSTRADLKHDLDRNMAYYHGRAEAGPTGELRVRLGGEWTDVDLPMLTVDAGFQVTAPQIPLGDRIDLSGPPVTFTWESQGNREVWMWFDGPKTRRLYRLFDDGEFVLDPFELNLDPGEVVDVGLASAARSSADLDGNRLDLVGLSGAGWKGSECGPWLDVPLVGGNPDPVPMQQPVYMGWGFRGIVDDGVHDYFDPDTGVPMSAELYFQFFDEGFGELCRIRYEADLAGRSDPLIVESGAELFQTFNVDLFNGESTCGAVSASVFGTADLRDYVEQFDWSFAIGEVLELEDPLSAALGPQWATQSPFLYSVFWSQDGLFGDEQGYGYSYELSDCWDPRGAVLPAPVPPPAESVSAPRPGMPPAFYFTFPYYVERVP